MLLREELFSFTGLGGSASRCRLRLFLPAKESGDDTYIAVLTDDQDAGGTNITNAVEALTMDVCRRFNLPAQRTVFIEHHDFRHRLGNERRSRPGRKPFAQITFAVPETASGRFDYSQGQILGAPKVEVHRQAERGNFGGGTLVMTKPKPKAAGMKAPAPAHVHYPCTIRARARARKPSGEASVRPGLH